MSATNADPESPKALSNDFASSTVLRMARCEIAPGELDDHNDVSIWCPGNNKKNETNVGDLATDLSSSKLICRTRTCQASRSGPRYGCSRAPGWLNGKSVRFEMITAVTRHFGKLTRTSEPVFAHPRNRRSKTQQGIESKILRRYRRQISSVIPRGRACFVIGLATMPGSLARSLILM